MKYLHRIRFTLMTVVLSATVLPGCTGEEESQGRRGNQFYTADRFSEAVDAYRAGLPDLPSNAPHPVRHGLTNNMGAALYRMHDYAAAGEAFAQALIAAPTPSAVARAAYNAGNGAYAQEQLDMALSYYRQALLADPDNEEARFNYEYVARQIKNRQQESKPGNQQGNQKERQPNDQAGEGEEETPPTQESEEGPEQPQPGGAETGDPQPRQGSAEPLTPGQAENILDALERDDEALQRQARRLNAPARPVEKDW